MSGLILWRSACVVGKARAVKLRQASKYLRIKLSTISLITTTSRDFRNGRGKMRLMNVNDYGIPDYFHDAIPRYNVLSRTWGDSEMTFHDTISRNNILSHTGGDGGITIQEMQ